jgi:phosphoglycolate phosphatase
MSGRTGDGAHVRCIAFDFDGTLVQSNAIKRRTFYEVSRSLGDVDRIVDQVLRECAGDRTEVLETIVAKAAGAFALPAAPGNRPWAQVLVERFSHVCEEAIVACPEVPGAMAALDRLLGGGFPLFINSATPTLPLVRILDRRDMTRYFRAVYGGDVQGKTGNLRLAMQAALCGPEETVFIGDNEVDRRAAEEIGCRYIGIENEVSGYRKPPVHKVGDMAGAEAVLAEFARGHLGGRGEKLKGKASE